MLGLSQVPDDLVAAIVLRAFTSSGASLRARLNMGLVCRRVDCVFLANRSALGH